MPVRPAPPAWLAECRVDRRPPAGRSPRSTLTQCLSTRSSLRTTRCRPAADARHAALGADPHLAVRRDCYREDAVGEQTVAARQGLPGFAGEARHAGVGAEPHGAGWRHV